MQLHLLIQDTAVLISTLAAICFSFCIVVFTAWFKNAGELTRMFGFSFIPVFLLHAASLIYGQETPVAAAFTNAAEPVLLLLFVMLLAAGANKILGSVFIRVAIVIAPVLIITLIITSGAVRDILSGQTPSLSALTVLSVLLLYLLKKRDGMDLLFEAVFFLLVSAFVKHYLWQSLFLVAAPVFKIAAYWMMLRYFYRVYLQSMLAKSEENKKKLDELNRSIEHEVKKRMLELEKVNRRLVDISKTDAISQGLNKSALLESIGRLITNRSKSEFSILMFDIDHFKTINDTYGHVTGDKCIRDLSINAKNSLRDVDIIGRFGGDEFIVILPGTGVKQAIVIAERFRKHIAASSSPRFTISIGVACYPSDGTTVNALVEAADKGLYASKQKGRDAVSHLNNY